MTPPEERNEEVSEAPCDREAFMGDMMDLNAELARLETWVRELPEDYGRERTKRSLLFNVGLAREELADMLSSLTA